MVFSVKQFLVAFTAAVVFAQTGVTQLSLDDTYKTIIIFGVGMLSVFLQTLVQNSPPSAGNKEPPLG